MKGKDGQVAEKCDIEHDHNVDWGTYIHPALERLIEVAGCRAGLRHPQLVAHT